MKRLQAVAVAGLLLTGVASAVTTVDSIKTFTGAARVKFVWERTAYCNADYTPLASPVISLILFDTDEGVERVLDPGTPHTIIRISRSGKWVTWNNLDTKKSYIMDISVATPTKKLLFDGANCTYWTPRTWWIDPSSHAEYVFCLNNYGPIGGGLIHGDGIYKVAINADGTPGAATKLVINGNPYVDDFISVSQDGNKLGGAFPWPDTKILDIPTGRLDLRHEPGFGCQASLAPDNSYRFTHCQGDHFGLYMFAANMVDQHWYIDMSHNLIYFGTKTGMDFEGVHWSNNAQFMVSSPPMNDNWDYLGEGHYAGQTAAWIKANTNIIDCKKTVLHKYTADFKDIEGSIAIADIRYGEAVGDAWLSNGVTGSAPTSAASPAPKANEVSRMQIEYSSGRIAVTTTGANRLIVDLTDSRGRLVRRWNACGNASLDARDLRPGAYCIAATNGPYRLTRMISVK